MGLSREQVTIYTEVGNHCLKYNLAPVLRLWHILRYEDKRGGSYVPHPDIYGYADDLGITTKRIQQVLQRGMGVFWTDEGDGVRYVSRDKLAHNLGLYRLGQKVQVDVGYLYANLKTFKAALYAVNFARDSWKQVTTSLQPAGGKTISRKALEELTGISRPAQYQYEEIMGIKVDEQYAYANVRTVDELLSLPVADRFRDGKRKRVFVSESSPDGETEVVWQISNRYSTDLESYSKARMRSNGSTTNGDAGPRKQRMYFADNKSVKDGRRAKGDFYVYSGERSAGAPRTGRYYRFYPKTRS